MIQEGPALRVGSRGGGIHERSRTPALLAVDLGFRAHQGPYDVAAWVGMFPLHARCNAVQPRGRSPLVKRLTNAGWQPGSLRISRTRVTWAAESVLLRCSTWVGCTAPMLMLPCTVAHHLTRHLIHAALHRASPLTRRLLAARTVLYCAAPPSPASVTTQPSPSPPHGRRLIPALPWR